MLGKKSTAKEVVDHFGAKLESKTAIVTGGNSGIGVETCKALAYAGCRVIMCSRSLEAAHKAIEEQIKQDGASGYAVPSAQIVAKQLDLADLRSIKTFAEDILATESRIDFLVLNAGVMACPLAYTKDGFEMQIGTNHFGHFYLTQLLLPKMKAQSSPSRIVVVSSLAHNFGWVVTDDLHFKKGRRYNSWTSYGQSKLANVLFCKALADRLAVEAPQIKTFSLHPGAIATNLQRSLFSVTNWLIGWLFVNKTVTQGASTSVFACLAPELETQSGAYLDNCAVATPSKAGQDVDKTAREQLWEVTSKQIAEALA